MKPLFCLPVCCFLFFLAGNMTGCGRSASNQEPVVSKIPVKPAGAPVTSQAEKPAEKPEASKAAVAQKESVKTPEKTQAEKPAAKLEASKAVGVKKEPAANPQLEKPVIESESSAGIAAKKKVLELPSEAQLKEAAKALTEAAKNGAGKKNAPKPKRSQADNLPVVELTVNQNEWVEHNTGMGGDEQGVTFMVYSKHQQNCSILRDKTTGYEAVFRYRSKAGYLGKDSVELEYSDHQPGSGPDDPGTTTKTRQVINITVVANEKK
jgi:hypothetical protein